MEDGECSSTKPTVQTVSAAKLGNTQDFVEEGAEIDEIAMEPSQSFKSAEEEIPAKGIDPGSDPSNSLSLRTCLAFILFGAGSGWMVVNALYLQLPIYQRSFGLATSNRMEIGYNMGTLAVPCFALFKTIVHTCGRRVHYKPLIYSIAAVNLMSMLIAASGIASIDRLVLLSLVGGTMGYLVGFVHQTYILLRYDNRYLALFWMGDAAGGALAAVLACLQRPDLEEQGMFSPQIFFLILLPLVPLSLIVFEVIERNHLGRLPSLITEEAEAGADDDDDEPDIAEASLVAAPGGTELECDESVAEATRHHPNEMNTAECTRGHPNETKTTRSCLRKVRKVLGKYVACLRTRPRDSLVLMSIVFWTQFANWGVGDSIYPYACEYASSAKVELDGGIDSGTHGDTCVFYASLGTVFAEVLGHGMAVLVQRPMLSTLSLPAALFTVVFCLLFLASSGGFWAKPFGGGIGWYVVFLVAVMRILGPFQRTLANRLIQIRYEPSAWEDVNCTLQIFGTASNVLGAFAGLLFVQL